MITLEITSVCALVALGQVEMQSHGKALSYSYHTVPAADTTGVTTLLLSEMQTKNPSLLIYFTTVTTISPYTGV